MFVTAYVHKIFSEIFKQMTRQG